MIKNFDSYLEVASATAGKSAESDFMQEMEQRIADYEIESFIEKLLFVAIHCWAATEGVEESDGPKYDRNGKECLFYGYSVEPQFGILSYKVDFLIRYDCGPKLQEKVLVECDSQEFHERTEQERRYEKKRDREITGQGYRILRYTGKEIMEEPYKIADEILKTVKALIE